MKRFLCLVAVGIYALSTALAASGNSGDRILGVYKAEKDGAVSKVRISKTGENTYRAQVFWIENETNPDGSIRTDRKNPDPAKRSTPSSQVVLIESVSYDAEEQKWQDGQIYDPTSGKTYKVVIVFDDPTTLRVRGYWGPFSSSMYWKKIE